MSKNGRRKMFLRDSLVGWLGEFVALNKTPDCRLSSASQQFLNEAILEERHRAAEGPRHLRSVSSQTTVLRLQQRLRNCNNSDNNAENAVGNGGAVPHATVCHVRHASMPCGDAHFQMTTTAPRLRCVLPQRFRRGGREEAKIVGTPKAAAPISEMDESAGEAVTKTAVHQLQIRQQ